LALFAGLLCAKVFAQDQEVEQIPKEDSLFLRQTRKKNWAVGGNFAIGAGFENNKVAFVNNKLLVDATAGLKFGKFVSNKLLLGGNYQILTTNFLFDFQNEFQILSQYVSGLGRLYVKPGFFTEASYGLGLGLSRRFGQSSYEDNFWGRMATVGMGLSLFWFEKTHFEFQVKYHHYRARPFESEVFEVGGLGLHAGLTFVLNPKP
jgi:hypothetical protein